MDLKYPRRILGAASPKPPSRIRGQVSTFIYHLWEVPRPRDIVPYRKRETLLSSRVVGHLVRPLQRTPWRKNRNSWNTRNYSLSYEVVSGMMSCRCEKSSSYGTTIIVQMEQNDHRGRLEDVNWQQVIDKLSYSLCQRPVWQTLLLQGYHNIGVSWQTPHSVRVQNALYAFYYSLTCSRRVMNNVLKRKGQLMLT